MNRWIYLLVWVTVAAAWPLAAQEEPATPELATPEPAASEPAITQESDAAPEPDASQEPADDDSGLFAQPDSESEADPDSPRIEGVPLPMGEPVEIEGIPAALLYTADSPGMLTVIVQAPGATSVQMRVNDDHHAVVHGAVGRGASDGVERGRAREGELQGMSYLTVPITQAGEYHLALTVEGELDSPMVIGGAWVAFEQLSPPVARVQAQAQAQAQAQNVVEPEHEHDPEPEVDPTQAAVELALGHAVAIDTTVAWLKIETAEEGTLVFSSAGARGGSVSLGAYREGHFDTPSHHGSSSDRSDNIRVRGGARGDARGGDSQAVVMFHADAGEVWYLRVEKHSAGRGSLVVSGTLVLDAMQEAAGED